ncbi:MAG TPA: SulP family inorganic anion transporter [Baekduia sp.]|uniref:SulP family inorganic anion transporter n=1 Tax=Baekduia sp. TaxID=2600305 RepID=UPI002D783A5F|nr:SulP family inorganic anion transporter [Baekduia sp.]HET6510267.1 SulP family inorganic anion transporter [Baekduia sp.]
MSGASASSLVPSWLRAYDRAWLRADLVAGIVVWSVVAPQAVAYAQIAGLPPAAGLMAAPGALLAYAALGTSRFLIVSATTATSAVSAASVGPLADGDAARFAALSAALAIVAAVVLMVAGALRMGAIADLISKPVMVGFTFGLGLTIAMEQLPSALGLPAAEGTFVDRLGALARHLGDVHAATAAVAAACLGALVALRRWVPRAPAPLVVLVGAIVASALLDLHGHGVGTVGRIPQALPDPAWPDVSAGQLAALVAPSFGILLLTAESIGVSRALGTKHDERVDASRDLFALGASNLLGGLSSGFVQSGGASQTAAAEEAGARTPLTAVVCAVLVALTGAFLGGAFTDLPQATLAAVVIVAVSGFWDWREVARIARVRRSAAVFTGLALVGVLGLGVLQGLIVAAGLALVYIIRMLAGVDVTASTRADGTLELRPDGPLFYANVQRVQDHVVGLVERPAPAVRPRRVVLDLSLNTQLDVQAADVLGEIADALRARSVAFVLVGVRPPVLDVLARAGVADRLTIGEPSDDHLRSATWQSASRS